MKTIGLIGGMSWESSAEYYRIINEAIRERLGGLHSAKSILYTVDFAEVDLIQRQRGWQDVGHLLAGAARSLEGAGADIVILCTNTMHKVAGDIQANIHIPFLHIADAAAQAIKKSGMHKVGLLGTRFTMEEDFYTSRLVEKHGLDVAIPGAEQREIVHRIIYDELVLGKILPTSRKQYVDIISGLVESGAEGIILGCTEIGLLVRDGDCQVPLFDTTKLHAEAAVEYALAE